MISLRDIFNLYFKVADSLKQPKNDDDTIKWLLGKAVSNKPNDAEVYELWIQIVLRGEQYSNDSLNC